MAAENPPGTYGNRQRVIEYALITSSMVVVFIVGLVVFGTQIGDVLSLIADTIHD